MANVDLLPHLAEDVLARAAEAVVRVGRHGGRGCGVVLSEGHVVTNAHNVRGAELTVTFAGGRSEIGTVTGIDVDGELAVVEVDTGDATPLTWAPTPPGLGSVVFALARTAAGDERLTVGTVSSIRRAFAGPRGRRIRGAIEHTAPLARGSSGSALLDPTGALVGLNTSRLGEGFYAALRNDDDLRRRLDQLLAGVSPVTPTLGVGLAPARVARRLRRSVGLPERDGLLVRVVEADSPAERAGLLEGDLLTAAGDSPLQQIDDLFDAVRRAAEVGQLTLHVVRGVDELEVSVRFDGGDGEAGPTAK